jgi:benzoyl-CoA reductase/2-hydroxyglutaryl-CoA dehydratase subunit BcrC/BadD/HgdB
MASREEKKGRALEASYLAPRILKEYWLSLHEAKAAGRKIAWVSGNAPAELLYAFGVAPAYPENYAAVLASVRMSEVFCRKAEEKGFSRDLCSYARSNLGNVFWDRPEYPELPFGGLPDPDVLITTRIPCITQVKWWEVIRDHYSVPMFSLDAPFTATIQTPEKGLEYVHAQLHDLIEFLEGFTGERLNGQRFMECLELSDQAAALWNEILDLRANIPCPVGSREMCGNVFSLVSSLGTPIPVNFFQRLLEEMKEKVRDGVGAIADERIRLMLDNIPFWHHLGLLSDVEKHGAIFVFETYLRYVWGGRINLKDPYYGYAEKLLTEVWLNSGLDLRKELLKNDIEKYAIDGVVFLSNRSCKRYSLWQLELQSFLKNKLDIPAILIEGDMADPSGYSQEQAIMRMEAFLEIIMQKKETR